MDGDNQGSLPALQAGGLPVGLRDPAPHDSGGVSNGLENADCRCLPRLNPEGKTMIFRQSMDAFVYLDSDGNHMVSLRIAGREVDEAGPFDDATEALMAAERAISIYGDGIVWVES